MFAKAKPDSWKEIEGALLKVNDLPVKDWNVYQVRKKSDPLLFQMGNRFLLIDIHDKQLFELDPSKIEHKSGNLLWDSSDHPTSPRAAHIRGLRQYRRARAGLFRDQVNSVSRSDIKRGKQLVRLRVNVDAARILTLVNRSVKKSDSLPKEPESHKNNGC